MELMVGLLNLVNQGVLELEETVIAIWVEVQEEVILEVVEEALIAEVQVVLVIAMRQQFALAQFLVLLLQLHLVH
jgi:hypothetical protein